MVDFLAFSPTHAVTYRGERILVQSVYDGEFATEKEYNAHGYFGASFSIDEDDEAPTTQVFVRDDDSDFLRYKDPDFPIELVRICFKCHSDRIIKNGKTESGYRRYRCLDCENNSTGNPVGRPPLHDRKLTNAEKQKLYRDRKKKKSL